MSTNLYFKPVVQEGEPLSDQLKYALQKGERSRGTFDGGDLPYLRGLYDAGIEDAEKLIIALNECNEIIVWEE